MRGALADWLDVVDARGRVMATIGLLLGFAVSILEIMGAGIVAASIQLATATGSTGVDLPVVGDVEALLPGATREGDLRWMALIGSVFFVVRGAAVLIQQYVTFRSSFSLSVRLTDRVMERLLQRTYAWHLGKNSAELSTLAVGVCQNFASKVFTPLQLAGSQLLTVLSLLSVALVVEPVGAVTAMAALGGVMALSLWGTRKQLGPLGEVEITEQAVSQRLTIEAFQAVREVKLLDLHEAVRARIRASRRRWAKALRRSAIIVAAPRTIIETAAFCALITLVAYRAQTDGASAIAGVGVLGYVVIRILPTANNLVTHLNTVRSARASARRLAEVLRVDAFEDEARLSNARAQLPLEASNVHFSYASGEPVLRGIDLRIVMGTSTGLVGSTGSGKSTLLDVVAGLLDPSTGEITLNGAPLVECRSSWWQQIGIVPQHITLLDASLAANIALGVAEDEIDARAMVRAVELAQLGGVVAQLPEGLDTALGERGVRLSGGQRQRVAIARALYHDPPVILMDEGTSALDAVTEQQVVAALRADRNDRTLLMIAHRIATLRRCDEILVLENGRIVEHGTYERLLQQSARFRELAAADPT